MNLDWSDDRCIVCALTLSERSERNTETALLTDEHLIPGAIGGKLTCKFLCKQCNDHLGSMEARFKNDARIRLAINKLKPLLPNLWKVMSEGQHYALHNGSGRLHATLRDGQMRVDSSTQLDESLVLPAENAPVALCKMLKRRGATQNEIACAVKNLSVAPEGVRSKITDGIEITKSVPTLVFPVLDSGEINPLALLKIAYEYLALNLGGAVFHDYFGPVRRALLLCDAIPDSCQVGAFRAKTRGYEPCHGLSGKNTTSGITVNICLFGLLRYRVEFSRLNIAGGEVLSYTVHLDTGQEEWVKF